jgi:hypothetical protein
MAPIQDHDQGLLEELLSFHARLLKPPAQWRPD